jgi:hypothetical protein
MRNEPRRTDENHQPIRSRSYILRLWCADESGTAGWYASLENPTAKERYGFSSLEQLFVFLMELGERESGMSGGISSIGKGGG